jgi:nuclear pore complex protein Nup54
MSGVRERARILQEETEKLGKKIESQQNGELLNENDQKALDKVRRVALIWEETDANVMVQLLQDYDRQLEHLKKWVIDTQEEYKTWETEQQTRPTK